MAISEQEKAAWQKKWDNAEPAGQDIPEGEYEFTIVEAKADASKVRVVCKLQITGGNEEVIGKTPEMSDNLLSDKNMQFFKRKLGKLGIAPKSLKFDYLFGDSEESLCSELLGKVFAGKLQYSEDFQNIYVNRSVKELTADELAELVGKSSSAEEEEEGESADSEEEEGEEAIVVGDVVKWESKKHGDLEGEVKELLDGENEGKARVYVKVKDITFRVLVEKLEAVYEEEGGEAEEKSGGDEEEEGKEEGSASSNGGFPEAAEVRDMRVPALKKLLKENGVDIDKVISPREFAAGVAGFLHEKNYRPELKELSPLCKGLGMKYKKGTKPSIVIRQLDKKVQEVFA